MATRSDAVILDEIYDILDQERDKAWEGIDAPAGTPDWNVAVEKIKTINNICGSLRKLNAAPRHDTDIALKPIWESSESLVFSDYVDGTGSAELRRWAAWVCPTCGWFVGEQFIPSFAKHKPHNQKKCNFCSQCGQRIDWQGVETEGENSNNL